MDNAASLFKVVIKQPIGVVRYPGVAKGLYVASPEGYLYYLIPLTGATE